MSEFIFPCPSCGKDIQCDESYSGMQINCPICQGAIVVPQLSAPPTPATMRPSAMIGSAGRTAYQPPPPKKSGALRTTLIIAAIVVVCAALGGGGWYFYSKHKAKADAAKGNPAAQVTAPNAQATIQALSVLSKMQAAYTNVTSTKADGTVNLFLNLSNLTLADITPNPPPNMRNLDRHPPGMPNMVSVTMDFSMKSTQSNWYCMSGDMVMKIDGMGPRATTVTTMTNTFASWSSDQGRFMFTDSHQRGQTPMYQKLPDIDMGNNPAEQIKNMQNLFKDPANLNKIVKDLGQTADEPLNGQDLYTLTGKVLGQKVKIWVDKTSYMISQCEITLGGAISDADIDDVFSLVAVGFTNMPPVQLDMVKAQMKQMVPGVMKKIRGIITVSLKNVEINPALTADDFNYPVPAGVRLRTLR
jgi:hypothetical protein